MKILAIDTATERCSVALRVDGTVVERAIETARGHADLILPMVEAVLAEGGLALRQLDGIAFGRGPGAFTGVRIAVGVVQGLAFGAELLTVGVSDLAAVAQQTARPGDRILVCTDARMAEVYWATFECDTATGLVRGADPERVGLPGAVQPALESINVLAGTGFHAYPQIATPFPGSALHADVLPRAREIAVLGEADLRAGHGLPASEAQPVYVRDRVAVAKQM